MGVCTVFLWTDRAPWVAIPGHAFGETDNHLWMFWRAVQGLHGDPTMLINAPAGLTLPLMDPVNLPPLLALWWAGPGIAWTGLRIWNMALALAGGWLLCREVAGPRGAVVGMVTLGAAPFLAGMHDFGITESWPAGWLAFHVAFLLRHARDGARRDAVLAGLCLGAVALSGWYMALFGLLAEALVVPVLWWRTRRAGLVWQGLIGLAMALPALWIHLDAARDGGLWEGRWHAPSRKPVPRVSWMLRHMYGADLWSFVLPRWDAAPLGQSVYLGLANLALAGVGLQRRPRVVVPLFLVVLVFVALACGYWPTLAGRPLGFAGPAHWLVDAVPPLAAVSHWHRAVGAALPFLAAAVAVGVESLPDWRPLRWLLAGLVLAEGIVCAVVPWPRSTTPMDAPFVLMTLPDEPGPSGVIQLPFDNGREPFSQSPARLYNRWQVLHGHPVSENYEGRDALLDASPLVAAFDHATGVPFRGPPSHRPRSVATALPEGVARVEAVRSLRAWGYRWVVLHADRAKTPEAASKLIEEVLGRGVEIEGGIRWDLTRPADADY